MTNFLLEQFKELTTIPGSVPKLKEIILQLAVEGRLTADWRKQNPDIEPASVLLEKIKKEKQRLEKEGKIKKKKPLPEINPEEIPFEVPESWEWVRLGKVTKKIQYGFTTSAVYNREKPKFVRISDIQDGKINWNRVPGCEISNEYLDDFLLSTGDILIARTGGTIGKSYHVNVIPTESVFASYLIRIQTIFIDTFYINHFFKTLVYWRQLFKYSKGTGQPNVNATSLKALIVPIPPLSEQQEIVRRVDRLMEICDRLEEELKRKQTAGKQTWESLAVNV